jgi:hypothetical protein
MLNEDPKAQTSQDQSRAIFMAAIDIALRKKDLINAPPEKE